jgi:DNA modification methylase
MVRRMTTPHYSNEHVTVYAGDCLDVLADLPAASVDAVVTDPPYGLEFMGKEWDRFAPERTQYHGERADTSKNIGDDRTKPSSRHRVSYSMTRSTFRRCEICGKREFSGSPCICPAPTWRYEQPLGTPTRMAAYQQWGEAWAAECLRVLKPGGHLLAFGGTRTWHRLAAAIEDAGFEIRDSIAWLYGSGFPKSLDVSKAIDRAAGADREVLATGQPVKRMIPGADQNATGSWIKDNGREFVPTETAPATDVAKQWAGWGTALKPAFEPIVVARKPLQGTVAGNVQTYGTGALNIDATRVRQHDSGESNRGDSRYCTCPWPEADQTRHSPNTRPAASSDAVRADRNDLPANVPQHAPGHPQQSDSLADCLSSPDSGDAHARTIPAADQVSVQPQPDADMSHDRCATCGYSRLIPSTPYNNDTAPHVESRAGEASAHRRYTDNGGTNFAAEPGVRGGSPAGRWPANVVLDDTQAAELDRQSGTLTSGANPTRRGADNTRNTYGEFGGQAQCEASRGVDSGGASRFFPTFRYSAKAPGTERPTADGIAHPTVKPVDLMRWLIRLITPPGGVVLDPFAGSGTTGEAAIHEHKRAILIEREATYLPLIVARIHKPMQVGFDFNEGAAG